MPISVTGSNPRSDTGFSLVELLAVLAILSLMVGAVVLNLPQPRSETDRASEAMAAQMSRFLDDGAVAGEMRAIGASTDGLVLYRHDGTSWSRSADLAWPDDARPRLRLGEDIVKLSDDAAPQLLFEPYGAVPDFSLALRARDGLYELSANDRGRIVRTVER